MATSIIKTITPYVNMPWILLFPAKMITELTRNSCILFAATQTGSDARTIATLGHSVATKLSET